MTISKKVIETEHIKMVDDFLDIISDALVRRGLDHDRTKQESPELEIFEKFTPMLKTVKYGSFEYYEILNKMKPALAHHYANNRHHPEHFKNGVNGMTLIDLVEMFCDWVAAVKRHDDGDFKESLRINVERFGISGQLESIFSNTANEYFSSETGKRS